MSTWSDGYVSEIGYTYGYYTELNPNRVILPFLMAGLAAPHVMSACELGFGQGVSLNAHAAAGKATWWGNDFNPAHVGFAQELANQSGNQAQVVDQAFSEFCTRTDLPDFDFIGLHGIWSWVSNENRQIIVDFIRRKLKVGGVLYISYNTLPGWAAAGPIRHLLAEHAHVMGSSGQSMVERVQNSVGFAQQLLTLSHSYTAQVPSIRERIDHISKQSPHYLAHEYFNRDWNPMYFSDMQKWLEPAKVSYACSANYIDDFPTALFDEEQLASMNQITDPSFAQTVKDYLLNKQFRKDFWVKGARKISKLQIERTWEKLRFLLINPIEKVQLEISSHRKISLKPELFEPVLKILSDHQIHNASEILTQLGKEINPQTLYEVLNLLHAKGDLVLVQEQSVIDQAKPRTDRLNDYLLQYNQVSSDLPYLISPVTGGAIAYGRIEQLFLMAYKHGLQEPQEWATHAWEILKVQGEQMIKDGQVLSTEEANRAELLHLAQQFSDKLLNVAVSLGIL